MHHRTVLRLYLRSLSVLAPQLRRGCASGARSSQAALVSRTATAPVRRRLQQLPLLGHTAQVLQHQQQHQRQLHAQPQPHARAGCVRSVTRRASLAQYLQARLTVAKPALRMLSRKGGSQACHHPVALLTVVVEVVEQGWCFQQPAAKSRAQLGCVRFAIRVAPVVLSHLVRYEPTAHLFISLELATAIWTISVYCQQLELYEELI